MAIRTSQPPHLKKAMMLFGMGFLLYSMLVVATIVVAMSVTFLFVSLFLSWKHR